MSYVALDIGGTFSNVLSTVINVAVRVVIFLLIMVLGWIVGRWIRRLVGALLTRAGFDRAAERGGIHKTLGGRSASDLVGQLAMYAFLLFVLQLAFRIFGPNPISDFIGRVINWLPQLFAAIVIVVVVAAIAGWVRQAILSVLGGLSYGRGLATAAQVAIIALGVIAALAQVGVANTVITPILVAFLAAIVGIIVVGLGGGLIKPMQHRWERILNRAESETAIAAEHVRTNRAARAGAPSSAYAGRDTNQPGEFAQPAYGGAAPSDEQAPTAPSRAQAPPDHDYENQEFYEDRER
jgi:Mechanosensitive ion channel, conserved TM helix